MSTKPSYLGLLNAIAVGEGRGYSLLSSWSRASTNDELKRVLDFVAIREQEHSAAFTKRICELGFTVRANTSATFDEHLALAGSKSSDQEKFETILGYGNGEPASEDPLSNLFDNATIDVQTGTLLGRFIAEERDSGRRLRAQYEVLDGAAPDAELNDIAARLDRLTDTIEELKQMRQT